MISGADRDLYAFRRNTVVAASAGTGKTHRLTALYVLLVLGLTSMGRDDDRDAAPAILPGRIVATTFSRAAALEIRRRVERSLSDLASWDGVAPVPFADVVLARLAATGRDGDTAFVRSRAAEALARFGAARIDTLHGVASQLVRRHALALGLPPAARVLDDEEAEALSDLAIDETVGDALASGGARADAARALLAAGSGVHLLRLRLRRVLDRLDEDGLDPSALVVADHAEAARALADRVGRVARAVATEGTAALRPPALALVRAIERVEAGEIFPRRGVPALIELITTRLPARAKRTPADDELALLIEEVSPKSKHDGALALAAELVHGARVAERERSIVALLADARDRLVLQKKRASGLGFGDLLRSAVRALRDMPEIGAEAREAIDVLMVDELQDTSRVQRDLVFLLRERPGITRAEGAAPRAEDLVPHGLFLVGDRKQSIYGFRGADVAVFRRLCLDLAGAEAARALAIDAGEGDRGTGASFVALAESRRSGKRILDFVNAFSAWDFSLDRADDGAPLDFEMTYGPAERLVPALAGDPGEVVLVRDDGESPDALPPIVREAAGAAREGHVAAAWVRARIERGGASYRDVAVLARRRSTIPLVELALARLGVPYVVAGRALYDAPEVRDVAALLRLLVDPRDRLALATVLRGPIVALSDATLALLAARHGLPNPLASKPASEARVPSAERARLDAFRARFREASPALLRSAPSDAIRAAVRLFDLDRVIAALPRPEARLGNLDRLVGIATRRGGTLSGFVRWLERRIRDDADEAEAAVFSAEDDAVRLTTIHASKGLDFPIVVLVDLNAEPRPDVGGVGVASGRIFAKHFVRLDEADHEVPLVTSSLRAAQAEARARERAERKRLTYVALTRARRELALVGSAVNARGGSAWRSLSLGLDEGGPLRGVIDREVDAKALLVEAEALPRPAPTRASASPSKLVVLGPKPRARTIAIDARDLALFATCPRRFELRALRGASEPARPPQLDLFAPPTEASDAFDDVSARTLDGERVDASDRAMGRALARWADGTLDTRDERELADRLAEDGVADPSRRARDLVGFLGGAYAAETARGSTRGDVQIVTRIEAPTIALAVHARVDVLVEHEGGALDLLVATTTRSTSSARGFALPLRAGAIAVRRARPDARVRGGVVLAGSAWPVFVDLGEPNDVEAELTELASAFARARHEDLWPGRTRTTCERLGCGFLRACHRDAADVPRGT